MLSLADLLSISSSSWRGPRASLSHSWLLALTRGCLRRVLLLAVVLMLLLLHHSELMVPIHHVLHDRLKCQL